MELDWATLVAERNKWVAHNFPQEVAGRVGLGSVLGVIEELGELTHAHLKQDQGIRGDDEKHVSNAQDAVGDLTVYLLGVMHYGDYLPVGLQDPPASATSGDAENILLELTHEVGVLALDFLRGWIEELHFDIDLIIHHLRWYCHERGWDYEWLVQVTWDKVKQRDWIQYPESGLPPNFSEIH